MMRNNSVATFTNAKSILRKDSPLRLAPTTALMKATIFNRTKRE
jgi:hypothetical protein